MTGPVPPGGVIGILGGGQLGRMTALAAARIGYRCHIFAPDHGNPASQVTDRVTIAEYDDLPRLAAFADAVDVVTLEFENIPLASLSFLASRVPVRPGVNALAVSQHRVEEKRFAEANGVPVTSWQGVRSLPELELAAATIGLPAILKTCRFGYDGKGQVMVRHHTELEAAWNTLGGVESILEQKVPFAGEISVIVGRGLTGAAVAYPVVENRHVNHILDTTIAPAPVSEVTARAASSMAIRLADALDIAGLLAVEMFVLPDGAVLMNEIAPRPHNSGHWTQDGARTCQFEQLVRAVTGLPLGPVDIRTPTVMKNLIGADVEDWPSLLADPGARLHLYGKAETRPGRKMGHVNRLAR